jgi:hypothetical protein
MHRCAPQASRLAPPACVLLLLCAAAPVSAFDAEPGPEEASVRALEAASWRAWQDHDAAFFEQFLSADHVEVHAQGIVGKAAVVAGVRSPACVVRTYSLGPISATRVAEDTWLLTYRAEQDSACGGQPVPSPVWATSLYARRDGRWVNVMYQHTPLARP